MRNLLRNVVLEETKRTGRKSFDEPTAIVNDGGHLHDFHTHRGGEIEALGAHARHRALTADHFDDGANDVLLDLHSRLPWTLETSGFDDGAGEAAIDVEHHACDVL